MFTPQQTYDLAASKTLAQGCKSVVGDTCRYRHLFDDSIRCPAGHCIPDDLYRPRMEGHAVMTGRREVGDEDDPGFVLHELGHDLDLLAAIQGAHDSAHENSFVKQFKANMRNVAHKHGLSDAILNR